MQAYFKRRLLAALLSLLLLSCSPLSECNRLLGQQTYSSSVADTSSPRATLKSFIDVCNEAYQLVQNEKFFDRDAPEHAHIGMRIVDCLDTRELPEFARAERAAEVAVCLKELLDRAELPPWEDIPDIDKIEELGGIEKYSRWRIPGTRITIARIDDGPQRHEYLFSAGTVDRAVEYYRQIKDSLDPREPGVGPDTSPGLYQWYMSVPGDPNLGAIVQRMPKRMRLGRSYGLANWKWPALLIALAIGITVMGATYRAYGTVTARVREKSNFKYCLTIVFPIFAAAIPLIFLNVCEDRITIRGTPLYIISFSSFLVAIVASIFLVFAASNRIAATIIASPHVNPLGLNAQLIRIVSRLLSLTTSIVVLLVGGQYLGIPIATLLASAGIGGLALALGAQDTLKTLFGTVTLMADKPFRVGERIIFEKYDGVVEDIGLRSTRLRLLTGHLVTIPNDLLSRSNVENVGRREYIKRSAEVLVPLETPREKVEQAVQIIRDKLDNHEGMTDEYPPRVFFNEIGPDAFSIQFIYWYSPPNYWDFKAFGERVNFEIFRAFEENGIQFSLPSRHSFWKQDREQGPLDVKVLEK